jgi:hypothetical protein
MTDASDTEIRVALPAVPYPLPGSIAQPDYAPGERDALIAHFLEYNTRNEVYWQMITRFSLYGEISGEDDVALAKRWTEEIGVASIPLSVFCEQPFTGRRLRFCSSFFIRFQCPAENTDILSVGLDHQ